MNKQENNVINVTNENGVKIYNVWVGDKRVSSDNKDDVLGDGTVKYDPATFTMVLTGADINKVHTDIARYNYGIYTYDDMKLVLKGCNSIDISGYTAEQYSYGLRVIGVLTVSGSGSLRVTGGEARDGVSYGISSNTKIIITEGDITAEGASYGIDAWDAVSVSGGTLIATGSNPVNSCGIHSTSKITVSGGTVTASASDATNSSRGMDTSGDIIISGGSVHATSGCVADEDAITLSTIGNSYGIHTGGGDITITGGDIIVAAGSASENSLGMDAYGSINIKGGTVKATGGEAKKTSYGMESVSGTITIDGGSVEAQSLSTNGMKQQALKQAPQLGLDMEKISGDWNAANVRYQKDQSAKTLKLNGFVKDQFMSWFITTQTADKITVSLYDSVNGKKNFYVNASKQGSDITTPLAVGSGKILGDDLKLTIRSENMETLEEWFNNMEISSATSGNSVGSFFVLTGENEVNGDEDYNDVCVSITAWNKKG